MDMIFADFCVFFAPLPHHYGINQDQFTAKPLPKITEDDINSLLLTPLVILTLLWDSDSHSTR